jgi:ABC-2 type transport system permease protein
MTGLWRQELRLFLRQRAAVPALVLLALLSAASVWTGLAEIAAERETIARVVAQQAAEETHIAGWAGKLGDAGEAAYSTFHATFDPPSPLAFAALGQRDLAPWVLRVRALGLEAQLYEGENANPELALPGRFDWAFVLTYLAPLFVIVLLHDLASGEREAGRYDALQAIAAAPRRLWGRRVVVRAGGLLLAVAAPFAVGAALSGATAAAIASVLALTFAYVAAWALLSLAVGFRRWSSVTHAATLAAAWLVLTLLLPALAQLRISDAIPVRQGIELTLAQREAIHGAWDRPKAGTMQAFFRTHPGWRDTAPVDENGFHWKWYYAFQQVGDESVADQVAAYRAGLEAREAWTRRLGWVLPAVGTQVLLHRLANTDLAAQLAYQDRIREFHGRLRNFYYPYVFNDIPFREADFAKAPRWQPGENP